MIDITKEEFWENKNHEVAEVTKRNRKIKEFILKHKTITVLLISLGILMIVNIVLIYNFYRILNTI